MPYLDEQVAEALNRGPDTLEYALARRIQELSILALSAPDLARALDMMLIPVDASGNHGGAEWGYDPMHAKRARAALASFRASQSNGAP